MDQLPVIGYFPALPLRKNLTLGDWVVGPDFAEVPWLSDGFKRFAEAVIYSTTREDLKLPGARLWHRVGGFNGAIPDEPTLKRIAVAVTFATLNANDHLPDPQNTGHYLATAENAALYLRPIDTATGRITHMRQGFLNSHWILGHTIGGRPIALPDAVLPVSRAIDISSTLAQALFDRLGQADVWARRLDLALEWYVSLMANSDAVTHQQRIVALKTAFEILFGTDDSRDCARALPQLFETVTTARAADFPWVGVIWSPTERANLQRSYQTRQGKTKTDIRSELEDWFMTLARSRNEIIHQGQVLTTEYAKPLERPLSPYAGPLFWRGERILRETVKAVLGPDILLCGRHAFRDAMMAAFEEARRAAPTLTEPSAHPSAAPTVAADEGGATEEQAPPRPDKNLPALLAGFEVNAANEVLLDRDRRGARTATISWLVSEREWTLLKGAGAELVPETWLPCP